MARAVRKRGKAGPELALIPDAPPRPTLAAPPPRHDERRPISRHWLTEEARAAIAAEFAPQRRKQQAAAIADFFVHVEIAGIWWVIVSRCSLGASRDAIRQETKRLDATAHRLMENLSALDSHPEVTQAIALAAGLLLGDIPGPRPPTSDRDAATRVLHPFAQHHRNSGPPGTLSFLSIFAPDLWDRLMALRVIVRAASNSYGSPERGTRTADQRAEAWLDGLLYSWARCFRSAPSGGRELEFHRVARAIAQHVPGGPTIGPNIVANAVRQNAQRLQAVITQAAD